jgi:uncharacterized protein (TIGR02466 family)
MDTILSIFPTPVYKTTLEKNLSKKELLFVDKNKLNTHKNEGNITSNNSYILNEKEFKSLKKDITIKVQDYFDKIICPAGNITPYITQSWLNYTEENQFHHRHTHPNSLVSGVFYINSNDEFDKIKFFKDNLHSTIKFETKTWNLWNSETWWFPVKTGDLILFPSSLTHMVETKEGDNTRVSLAFNVFVKGKLGDDYKLTELIL